MRIDFRVTTNRRKGRSLASNPFRVYYMRLTEINDIHDLQEKVRLEFRVY